MADIVTKKYDVVVVGSGPAGIGAAFAAGRGGAKTLLIEKNAVLGGQMTSGLVTGFHGMRVHKGADKGGPESFMMETRHTDIVVKGLPLEIMDRITALGAAYSVPGDPPMRVEYDPEVMIQLLFRMAREYRVDLMLNTFVFGCGMKDGLIQYIRAANKSGENHISANCFVDASADADLAAWAGAPFEMGDEDKRCMPLSVYQVLGNVDLQKTIDYFKKNPDDLHKGNIQGWQDMFDAGKPVSLIGLRKLLIQAGKNGDYPRALGLQQDIPYPIFDIQTSVMPRGFVKLLVDMAYGTDITDNEELTRAEIDMRMNQVPGICSFMKKYVPGFENSYLFYTASLIGTRESRRIIGKYQITKDDVLSNRSFEDSIGKCGRAMNVHSSGGGKADQDCGGRQWIEADIPIGFEIPYRALVPRGVRNLLAAGRCISVDRDALGSIRGEPVCMVSGEAAGTAAAIASAMHVDAENIPVKKLQEELRKNNVAL